MKNILRALTLLAVTAATASAQSTLTVDVRNGNTGAAFAGVDVALVTFDAKGEPDGALTQLLVTGVSGTTSTVVLNGRDYQIALSTPGFAPTIRDQVMDPGGNFRVRLSANLTKQFTLYQMPAGHLNTMNIAVSSLSAVGQMVLLEVFINNQNREPMGYGIGLATATSGTTFQVHNLFQMPAGAFGVKAAEAGRGRAVETIMGAGFPGTSTFTVDLTGALPASKFENVTSTSAASVEGVIASTAGVPVGGMRINLSQYLSNAPNPSCNCILPTFLADAFTDGNGRFRFFDVPASSVAYNLYASKLGFYSFFTQVNRPLPTTPTVRLNFQVQAATYSLVGQLRYNGVTMPTGDVFSHSDYDQWVGTDTYAHSSRGAGHDGRVKVDGSGRFVIAGIPDGNVNLGVNFRGGNYNFNEGANGQRNYSGYLRAADDRRITVTSTTYTQAGGACAGGCPAGTTIVYNAAGLALSSGTLVFDISPPAAASIGVITGTVTFITTYTVSALTPVTISTSRPVAILATQDFQGGGQTQRIGVATLAGTFTSKTTTYTISVTTGVQYNTAIYSTEWGKASDFDDRADLKSTGTVVLNFDLIKSGRLTGQVRLPDGSNYRPVMGPVESAVVHMVVVRFRGVTSDGRCEAVIDEFGAFDCPNLAPGEYVMTAEPVGGAAVWPKQVRSDIVVYEGKTTTLVIKLKDALYVQPQIFGLPTLSTAAWHFRTVAFPAGFKLNQDGLARTFITDKTGAQYSADYSTTTGTWETLRMEPGLYDFYLLLESRYKPEPPEQSSDDAQSFHQFENFIGQLKNVAVQKSETNPNLGTKDQPIAVGVLGSVGQATVEGSIKGSRMFTLNDMVRIYANFNELFLNLPAVILYDNSGDLKGYAAGLPSEAGFTAVVTPLLARDTSAFLAALGTYPLTYQIAGLPPGKYTAIFMNPNYPPVVQELNLASGLQTKDLDFDTENVLTGVIRGTVISTTTGVGIGDATVSIRHRSLERVRRTDPQGRFRVENLPPGVYRVEAAKGGFTVAGEKAALSANGTLTVNLTLHPTTSTIRGTVFLRKFPSPAVKDGVRIVAYDETANVLNPEAYLPHLSVETGDDGTYEIPGVLPGHLYKLTVITPGKLIESILVTAVPGVTVADEIVLKDSPPEIKVKVRRSFEQLGKVDIIVKSPKELRAAPSGTFNPGETYDAASVSALTFVPAPENSFQGRFTPSPSIRYYTIRIIAGEEQNQLTKTVVFDRESDARSEQFVHENAIAGGEVAIDEEKEDFSGIELDAGSLTLSTGTVSDFSNLIGGFFSSLPSVRMVKTDRGTAESVGSLLEELLASEVYEIDLSSAQQNKSLTLTLKYDKALVTDTGALRIRQYDSATGDWNEVPGNYTVDPLTGVVSVNVESITEAHAGSSATAPLRRSRYRAAVSAQGTFVPSATSVTEQTGSFAVFSAAPPTGVAYGGDKFEIYNMPNPFNLKTKTVNLSTDRGSAFSGTTTDVRGTLIKYHLPAAKSGRVKLLLYNVAGELVREIDEGSRTGGAIYYSQWDGKNDDGSDCASGVYFLLTQVDGKKIGRKAHKMALVK